MAWIDSHCHLAMPQYDADRQEVLKSVFDSGCRGFIEVSIDLASTYRAIEHLGQYDNVYFALGWHPDCADHFDDDAIIEYKRLLTENKKVIALGEAGLDIKSPVCFQQQKRVYFRFCEFAASEDVPLIIHHRGYFDEIMSGIKKYSVERVIFHCFCGTPEDAEGITAIGAYISFSGIVTFKNAHDVRASVRAVPLNRILVETDSPYLAPQPVRGHRNTPANVPIIIDAIAQIKDLPVQTVAEAIYRNTSAVFDLRR